MTLSTTAAPAHSSTRALQIWSLILPAFKCAVCPVCLSLFGGLAAGASLGVLGDERVHSGIVAVALVADFFILRAAMRHHGNRVPLLLCLAGGLLALFGRMVGEAFEYLGFGLLIVAAIQNVILLRRHHSHGEGCCAAETRTGVDATQAHG